MRRISIKKRLSTFNLIGEFSGFRIQLCNFFSSDIDLEQARGSLTNLFQGFVDCLLTQSPFFSPLPNEDSQSVSKARIQNRFFLLMAATYKVMERFPSKQDSSTGKPMMVRLFKGEACFSQDTLLETHIRSVVEEVFESAIGAVAESCDKDVQHHIDFVEAVIFAFLRLYVAISKNNAPEEMRGLLAYLHQLTITFEGKFGHSASEAFVDTKKPLFSEPPKPSIWCKPPDRKAASNPLTPPSTWMKLVRAVAGPIHWVQDRLGYGTHDLDRIPVVPQGIDHNLNNFAKRSAAEFIETLLTEEIPFLDHLGRPFIHEGREVTGQTWFKFKSPLPMFRLELFPGVWMVVALDVKIAADFSSGTKGKKAVDPVQRLIGDTAFTNMAHKTPFKSKLNAEQVHNSLSCDIVAAAKRFVAALGHHEIKGDTSNARHQMIDLFMRTFASGVLGLHTIRNPVEISHIFGQGLEQVTTLTGQQVLGFVGAPSWFIPLPQANLLVQKYRQIVSDNPFSLTFDWRMSRMLTAAYRERSAVNFCELHSDAELKELGSQIEQVVASKIPEADCQRKIESLLRKFWPPSKIVMDDYSIWIRKMASKLMTVPDAVKLKPKEKGEELNLLAEFKAGNYPDFGFLCASCSVSPAIHSFLPYDLLNNLMMGVKWEKDPSTARQKLFDLYEKSEKRRLKASFERCCLKLSENSQEAIRAAFLRQEFECSNYDDFVEFVNKNYPDFSTCGEFEFEIPQPPVLDRWVDISVRIFRMNFMNKFFSALNTQQGQLHLSSLFDPALTSWDAAVKLETLFLRKDFNIEQYPEFLKFLGNPVMLCRISVQASDVRQLLHSVKGHLLKSFGGNADSVMKEMRSLSETDRSAFLRERLHVSLFRCEAYSAVDRQAQRICAQFISYMSTSNALSMWEVILNQDIWSLSSQILTITRTLLPMLPLASRTIQKTALEEELDAVNAALSKELKKVPYTDFKNEMKGLYSELQGAIDKGDKLEMRDCRARLLDLLKKTFLKSEIISAIMGLEEEKSEKYENLMRYLSEPRRREWFLSLSEGKGEFKSEIFRIFYSQELDPIQYQDSKPTFLKDMIEDRYNRAFFQRLPGLAMRILESMTSDQLQFIHQDKRAAIKTVSKLINCENREAFIEWLMIPGVLEELSEMSPEDALQNCPSQFTPIIPHDYELDEEELKAVLGVILAGSETSANAMIAVFSQMTPDIKARLTWEVRTVMADTGKSVEELLGEEFTKMTDPTSIPGDARGLSRFKEIDAYILSVLACYPPAPAYVRQPTEAMMVKSTNGEEFLMPPNTLCLVAVKELAREFWGKEGFRSFTFADGGDASTSKGTVYPRRCPGQFAATYELKVLLVMLLMLGMRSDNGIQVTNVGVASLSLVAYLKGIWGSNVESQQEPPKGQAARTHSHSSLLRRNSSELDTLPVLQESVDGASEVSYA